MSVSNRRAPVLLDGALSERRGFSSERCALALPHSPSSSRSEYIANFGVQVNFTNVSIALLFLDEGNIW